jgi:hypothetical protein
MKQLLSLFLFLLPCLVWAQYPSNGNQKITLGEQTTADGLIYRGVAATDTVRKPSIDTMAYMVLDTTTNIMWHYKKATSNAWLRVGGFISSGLTGTLPVANGGTGSATQNFVDLTTDQTVAGVKTFTDTIIVNKGIRFPSIQSASTNVNTLDDYEEGTWTTTFGTSNNLSGTPVLSNGIYRKVGQLVYLEGRITGLSVTATNTQTYIQFNAPIRMNLGSSNTVGNIYTFIGSTDITGVITDVSSDFVLLGVYIPKTLITSTGSLANLYLSITYVSEN